MNDSAAPDASRILPAPVHHETLLDATLQANRQALAQLEQWLEALRGVVTWVVTSRRFRAGEVIVKTLRLARPYDSQAYFLDEAARLTDLSQRAWRARGLRMTAAGAEAVALTFLHLQSALLEATALLRLVDLATRSRALRVGDVVVERVGKSLLRHLSKGTPWAPERAEELRAHIEGLRLDVASRLLRFSSMSCQVSPRDDLWSGLCQRLPVTIIVPIFGARPLVRRCIDKVLLHTQGPYRLVLLDDASVDPEMWPMLKAYAKVHPHIAAWRQEHNVGYTANVNTGLSYRQGGDVVLLNSDTEVTKNWLEKLREAAYSDSAIGTVTPLTNAGSVFSVPKRNAFNVLPSELDVDTVGAAVELWSQRLYPEVPTGNGFCLYIKADVLEIVERFDAELFPRGYGEENDFCRRAVYAGYRNVIDDRTFVFHAESASFGASKTTILQESLQRVENLHPGYHATIAAWLASPDVLAPLRDRLQTLWNAPRSIFPVPPVSAPARGPKPVVLMLHHEGSGGAVNHARDLAQALEASWPCVLLEVGSRVFRTYVMAPERRDLAEFTFEQPWQIGKPLDDARRTCLKQILCEHAIAVLHVHHLAGIGADAVEIAAAANIPSVYAWHDYFALCPSYNLIAGEGRFCAANCGSGARPCHVDLDWIKVPPLRRRFTPTWRAHTMACLAHKASAWVFFDPSVADFVTSLPIPLSPRCVIIPHATEVCAKAWDVSPPSPKAPVRILILGALSPSKGLSLVEELLERNAAARGIFEFHHLGHAHPTFGGERPHLRRHGSYNRGELVQKVWDIAPHFVMLASVWPETFSYTLSEAWACGVPVFASNLGAPAARIARTGGGWALDPSDASQWFATMVKVAGDSEGYNQCLQRVRAIEMPQRAAMIEAYGKLYAEVLEAQAENKAQKSAS